MALSIELNTIPLDLRSISAAQALEILFRGSENDRKIKQKVGLNNYLKKIDDCAQVLFINDELRDGYVDSHVELRNSITHRNWSKIEQGTASLDGETGLVKYPEKDTALLLKDYYQTVCLCLAGILCELGIPENNLSSLLMKKITEVKRVIEHLSVAE